MDAVIDDQELEARLFALEPAVAAAVRAMLAELCRSDDAGPDRLARTDLKAASRLLLKIALEHLTAAYGRTNAIGEARGRALADAVGMIASIGRPAKVVPGGFHLSPRPALEASMREIKKEVVDAVANVLGARDAARRGNTLGMRRDVVSAGLSMVLGAGDLLEMGLQDETATVICRQAYQDLLHGLLDAALASEAEGPDRVLH
jgi:hypothetical protein